MARATGADGDTSPHAGRLTAVLSALTTGLLVLSVGMVVTSAFVPTSPAPPAPPAYRSLAPAAPVRLVIRSLHVNAPVQTIRLQDDGVLEPPPEVADVGWWNHSAEPGARRGQTVITGHTDHLGGGAMDDLPKLTHGDVEVVTPSGTMRYRVTRAVVASHAQVARYAQDIFGQGHTYPGGARLVLVTCTDYNGSFYESNFIVVARALGEPTHLRART